MKTPEDQTGRGPRPFAAFLISFGISAVVLFLLLFSDHRVFELGVARARIRQLDTEIAQKERENRDLKSQIDAAMKHEFPAEKVAREELQMVGPADLVLLYPPGALTAKPTPARPSSAPAR